MSCQGCLIESLRYVPGHHALDCTLRTPLARFDRMQLVDVRVELDTVLRPALRVAEQALLAALTSATVHAHLVAVLAVRAATDRLDSDKPRLAPKRCAVRIARGWR